MPIPVVDNPALLAFAQRLQSFVDAEVVAKREPLPMIAGALIGAGVELSFRNGIDKHKLHQLVDEVVQHLEIQASA